MQKNMKRRCLLTTLAIGIGVGVATAALLTQSTFADPNKTMSEIFLSVGDSITIDSTRVTCQAEPSPTIRFRQECTRLTSLSPEKIYNEGLTGWGSCYIFGNANGYGVFNIKRGRQISPTYQTEYSSSVTNNYPDAATGYYQLICNGSCN